MSTLFMWHRLEAPGDSRSARVSRWMRYVAHQVEKRKGSVLGEVKDTLTAFFDAEESWLDALTLALELLEEDARPYQHKRNAGSFAFMELGDRQTLPPSLHGFERVLERLEILGQRARPGELVLEESLWEKAEPYFYSGRSILVPRLGAQGRVLDRSRVRKDARPEQSRFLARPNLPAPYRDLLAALSRRLRSRESTLALIQGSEDSAYEGWLDAAQEQTQAQRLDLLATQERVEALASLRLGLADLLQRSGPESEAHPWIAAARELYGALRGQAVDRESLRSALVAWWSLSDPSRPFWLGVKSRERCDEASLPALFDALELTPAPFRPSALLCRVFGEVDALENWPAEAFDATVLLELPCLRMADSRRVAEEVLGLSKGDRVALALALRGGDSVSGIEEVARVLVHQGRLVYSEGAFRTSGNLHATPRRHSLEQWCRLRLASLDERAREVLELRALADSLESDELAALCATLQGSTEAIALLVEQAWLEPRGLFCLGDLQREAVLATLPKAKTIQRHLQIAHFMQELGLGEHPYRAASLAMHWASAEEYGRASELLQFSERSTRRSGFVAAADRLLRMQLSLPEASPARVSLPAALLQALPSLPPPLPVARPLRPKAPPPPPPLPLASAKADARVAPPAPPPFPGNVALREENAGLPALSPARLPQEMALPAEPDAASGQLMQSWLALLSGDGKALCALTRRVWMPLELWNPLSARMLLLQAFTRAKRGERAWALRLSLLALAHARACRLKSVEKAAGALVELCAGRTSRSDLSPPTWQ